MGLHIVDDAVGEGDDYDLRNHVFFADDAHDIVRHFFVRSHAFQLNEEFFLAAAGVQEITERCDRIGFRGKMRVGQGEPSDLKEGHGLRRPVHPGEAFKVVIVVDDIVAVRGPLHIGFRAVGARIFRGDDACDRILRCEIAAGAVRNQFGVLLPCKEGRIEEGEHKGEQSRKEQ